MQCENTPFLSFTLSAYEESKHTRAQSVEQSAVLQLCLTLQKPPAPIVSQKSINETESLKPHGSPLKPAMFITLTQFETV